MVLIALSPKLGVSIAKIECRAYGNRLAAMLLFSIGMMTVDSLLY